MRHGAGREPSIWIDVEDVVDYFRFNPHPSGIQRVALALARALRRRTPNIRLARHAEGGAVTEYAWDALDRLLATPPAPAAEAAPEDDDARRSRLQRAIRRLPPELRDPLFRAAVLQSQALRNMGALVRLARPAPPRTLRHAGADGAPPAALLPGDLFLQLGAPWTADGATALHAARAAGLRTGLLVHDLIPLRRPEWQSPARVERFRGWLEASLPACDHLFTLSRFTAADLEAFASGQRGPVPRPAVLPAGLERPAATLAHAPGLPVAGTYALYVSTLEFRKNHPLLVSVWHKLLAEVRAGRRDAASVPQLVFAGRIGVGVADLLQQLDNSHWLGGRVRLVRDPSDAELHALYAGCRFTLMPSLYEGWGLPLVESLAFGKPCLAAAGTALPEAGGALCRYFDPEDLGDAHRAITAVLDDPEALAAWQARVAAEFRPRAWDEAAAALLQAVAPVPA